MCNLDWSTVDCGNQTHPLFVTDYTCPGLNNNTFQVNFTLNFQVLKSIDKFVGTIFFPGQECPHELCVWTLQYSGLFGCLCHIFPSKPVGTNSPTAVLEGGSIPFTHGTIGGCFGRSLYSPNKNFRLLAPSR